MLIFYLSLLLFVYLFLLYLYFKYNLIKLSCADTLISLSTLIFLLVDLSYNDKFQYCYGVFGIVSIPNTKFASTSINYTVSSGVYICKTLRIIPAPLPDICF